MNPLLVVFAACGVALWYVGGTVWAELLGWDDDDHRAWGLCGALLVLGVLALAASGCAGKIPDIRPERDPWPVRGDGTPYARCNLEPDYPPTVPEVTCDCATEGEPPGWEIRECPPEPTPTPTPEPTPDATPTPEPPPPTPSPTPEPTPPPAVDCPALGAFRCGDGDGVALGEALVRAAVRAVILSRPPYLVEYEERGSDLRAKLRTPDPEAEPDMWAFSRAVAAELRSEGMCAWAGDPNGRSPDEVLLLIGGTGEAWDLAKCGSHEPDGRYCVGTDLLHQPFDCRLEDAPEPLEPERVCTVTGHVGLTWPDELSACRWAMDWSHDPGGHTERHEIGGEVWYRDAGRGWYRRATCERYDSPGGTRLSGAEWFGVRCQ